MSQIELKTVSKEILDRAEDSFPPAQALPRIVDDYFIQRLKQDELEHASVDANLYEGLRSLVKAEVLPLYEQYRRDTERIRERKQKRKLWRFVVGTVAATQILEAIFTRGRSMVPQVFFPSAILSSFLGFIIHNAAQYFDDVQLARARHRLDKAIEGLDGKLRTDIEYDNRRQLLDGEVLHAEALEVLARYEQPDAFWRDYRKVREADPTVPAALKALEVPAFEPFLKFHVDGQCSAVAREQRFNRLFIEAQEVFISRDREHYALNCLERFSKESS